MKVSPVAGPGQVQQTGTPEHVRTAKAVAAFQKGASSYDQPPVQVVQNQSQVSVEELGAIKAQSNQAIMDGLSQNDNQVVEDTLTPPSIPEPNIQEPKAEDTPLSRQFAQLARQERALRQKQQQQDLAIKAREQALADREAALIAKDQEYKSGYMPKESLKNNPLQALLDAGVTYDDLTQQILNNSNPIDPRVQTTISKLEAKIQQLETAAEETKTTYKSAQEQQYEAAVKQIRTDAQNLVKNDPNYETIRETNSVKDVVDLIVRTYNEDGVLMTVEEAADAVEEHIIEEAVKLSRLGKVTKKLQSVAPKASPTPQQTAVPQSKQSPQPTMKTLTNAGASSRPLSARERALLAFKGELK